MKYKLLRFSLLSMLVMFFGGLAFADQITMKYSGSTTTNMTGENDAALLGLDADAWSVVGDKGACSNMPGLNKAGDIRLYWSADGGNTITVASLKGATINSISMSFTGASYSNVSVKVDGNAVEATDGAYAINSSSFVLGNANTSNTQVRISEIVINYTAAASTKTATKVTLAEGYATTGVVGGTIDLPTATVAAGDATVAGAAVAWTSSNTDVATIDGTTIKLLAAGTTTIKASFAGDDTYEASAASYTLTVTAAPYTSIAAMLADITSTKTTATYQFENLLVTYVNGSNTFVSDGRNGFLFYGSNLGLEAGSTYTGSATGQVYTYNGLPEMAVSASGISATMASEGNLVAWPTIAAADLQNYINVPVTIENAVFVSANNRNLTFKVGEETLSVYNNWSLDVTTLEADKAYTLTGVGAVYSKGEATTYQLYLVKFEEKAEEVYVYRDFAVNLTDASIFATDVNNFGVKVAADGTYTATAADDATANFAVKAARFNDAQHGWVDCVFTVPVQGCVKIELGDCQYGGQNGTITDAAGNSTEIKANATKKCWSANAPHDNVVVAYYAGTEPTTLTITYKGYCPFIAVTAIDPSEIPSEATLTYSIGESGAEGVAPVAKKVEIGSKVTIPANTTLYVEGKTLTAWTDGTKQYKAGEEVTVSEDITLTPVFTDNTVTFADRTAETTLTWQFGEKNGVGTLNAQGKSTILITQATIGENVIDVKMTIDATNGKINNVGRGDEWAQCNDGTILTIPAYKGTAVSFKSYSDGTGTTIGGAEATNKAATYDGTAETLDIVAKGMGYIASVTAVYPVPAADEEKFVDIKADFTNGSFFTAEETSVTTAGLKMNADGTFTRVAADDATANAVITGKFHSNEHGLGNFSATVKVLGTVKVSMGTCAWGGDVTVKNAEGTVVATFNTNTGACYHNDKEKNIVFGYYKVNEPTTLTISGGSYTPYFAVEAVSPEQIPNDVKFVFDITNAGAEGVAPEAETVAIGKDYTLPKNFTLYKEGNTLTGWTDGTNTYAPGQTITAPEATEITLTPVFTANEVSLADRTEAVTVKWNFRRDQGAPAVGWEGKDGLVWVAQAEVGGKTIDVALPFSTAPGKFNNKNNNDWVQINNGTKFTVPSCKGATISMEAYNEITTTTIDGQSDYTQGKTISYEIAGAAETVDVVIGDGSYYRYIQVVLPVVQSGPKTYTNEAATVVWPFNDPTNISAYTTTPEGVFSTVAANTGDITLTGTGTGQAKYPDGSTVTFAKLKPAGSTTAVEWAVKPASGLTFTPTKISAYIARFGTDAENGITISAKVGEGEAITLGNFTAPRNNKSQADDKFGSSSNYTNQFVIELTAEQQAALASTEGLSVFGTVGVGGSKEGGYAEMTIEGLINGTVAEVEKYTLATVAAPEEAGSINVYPKADEYEAGTEVTLTATENFGYDFVNWTNAAGEEVSTEAKFKYAVAANETLTANFKKVNTYELALTVDGTNDYMVTINPAPTVVDGKNMYEEGTTVQLVANQYEGLVTFTNWNDGETNSTKTVAMTENTNIVASYAEADIIAGWDFYTAGGSGRKADFAAQDNDADALNLVNTETGETQGWLDKSTLGGGGYESFKGAAVNWRTGTKNGDVGNWHWQTKVNAEAFTDIKVQFMMLYNYNSYQTYNAEYSLDGETWTKFGSITMTGAKAEAAFSEQMPAAANNQKDLYIRMLADKTSAVDGAASANDGNTLAMFFITGTPKLVDDGTAPKLVSSVPENGATGASATGKIVLTFDERIKVKADAKATLGNETLTPTVSGKTVTFEYKGLEYGIEYTFNLAANSVGDLTDNFLAEPITLTFTTMERPSVTKGLYDYVVANVDDLMKAIAAAESRSDKNVRYRIFIKNGEYTIPLSSTMKTVNNYEVPECITFINSGNISFIGESRDGVIITNGIDKNATFAGTYGTTSKYDGIGNSDVLQLKGSDYYFQDLTIESGMDDATGRDLAVQDKATRTIYKNTGLSGYQDTWTSNNDYGLYYFEGGFVRGRTDYMCGKGDAFFNGVEIRQIYGGYAAVPSKCVKYGYVYKDCTINGEPGVAGGKNYTAADVDGNYTLGRPWGSGTPSALFIDTKMNVVPSAIGWNEMSGGWPKRFAEYNSTTSTGSVIDLSGRKKIFGDGHENNPVLTAEEALEAGNLHNMFGEWDPTLLTEQAPVPANVKLTGTTLTWDNSNYALLFAIVKNGQVVDFTTDATYTVDDATATYAVRAANEMGGLGEAAVATIATGIEEIAPAAVTGDSRVYNLQGIRIEKAQKGVYIVNGKKIVIK